MTRPRPSPGRPRRLFPRRAAPAGAWLTAACMALAACTGTSPTTTAAPATTAPPAAAVVAPPSDGDRVLTELAAEVTPDGVVLSWKVDERHAGRVTGFTCVYRTPAHLRLGIAGSVACGEPLSAAGDRRRVVTGLPEYGEYLFEVTAQVGAGATVEWSDRALQLHLPVTRELAGPAGADLTVTGQGPIVFGCGPGGGPGDAPPDRPWRRGDIVSAEHLTHYPGRGWAPGGDVTAAPEWPEPPSLAQLFDDAGLDGQAVRQVLDSAGTGSGEGPDPDGDGTGAGIGTGEGPDPDVDGDRDSAVDDAIALLADDASAVPLARASAGTKALLRPGAAPDSGWELKLHTSYPFGGHYVYEPTHAAPGWSDPAHAVAWAGLWNRTDCPPPEQPDASHDVALALSDDAGGGRRLEHSGYGWWAVAPVGMFPERIVATKGSLAYGDPAAASPASPAAWQGRLSGHLFWDQQRYALSGEVTLALAPATSGSSSAQLSGRIDNVVLVPLDHATLEPLREPPLQWPSLSLDTAPIDSTAQETTAQDSTLLDGTGWSGIVTVAQPPTGTGADTQQPAAALQMPPAAFSGDWHAEAHGPAGTEIAGRLRLWTPLPEGADPNEAWPAQAVLVAGFGAAQTP